MSIDWRELHLNDIQMGGVSPTDYFRLRNPVSFDLSTGQTEYTFEYKVHGDETTYQKSVVLPHRVADFKDWSFFIDHKSQEAQMWRAEEGDFSNKGLLKSWQVSISEEKKM